MDMLPLHEEGNQPEVRATSLGGHQHAKQQVCFSRLPVCAGGQDTLEHRPKTAPPHGLATDSQSRRLGHRSAGVPRATLLEWLPSTDALMWGARSRCAQFHA